MNIPRYRKSSIPLTNPFGNNVDGHIELPQKSIRSATIDQTTHISSNNRDLSFNEYASAIQQGLHVDNFYNSHINYPENDGNYESYSLPTHPRPREPLDVHTQKPDNHHQQQPDYQKLPPNNVNAFGNLYQPIVSHIISTVDPKASYLNPASILSTLFSSPPPVSGPENPQDEKKLLEELGIDFNDVYNMFKSVILFQKMDSTTLNDADMFGPICILIFFGISLMLSGRLTFNLLYAIAVFGSICIYMTLNCMSQDAYIDLYTTMIILGYSTLPIVPLPIIYNAVRRIWIGLGTASFLISLFWSTAIASMFFETILYMSDKRYMIAYPTLLFYLYFSFVAIL